MVIQAWRRPGATGSASATFSCTRKHWPSRWHSRCAGWAVGLMAILIVAGGCGSNIPPQELTEDDLVRGLPGSVYDLADSLDGLRIVFAEEALPPVSDLPRYQQYRYDGKRARISGEQADITVAILDADGKEIAEMTWKAVKQGGGWKLTEAPLP
jgi:hypothetical protein